MQDFIHAQGLAFFAHLLRRLSDEFGRGAAEWLAEIGISAPQRTVSTLIALDEKGPLSVTELAELLRQSHPLMITWVRQLTALGFVAAKKDANDGRRTVLRLTRAGEAEIARLRKALQVVARAYSELIEECGSDVVEPLWRIEQACQRESFAGRLRRAGR